MLLGEKLCGPKFVAPMQVHFILLFIHPLFGHLHQTLPHREGGWDQYFKTFYCCNLQMFIISWGYCPWRKPFQLNLMFADKVGAYPSEAPFRCSTLGQAPGTHKHQTRLEGPARNKHSNILRTFVNYRCKKCYRIGPSCQSYKILFLHHHHSGQMRYSIRTPQNFSAQSNIFDLGWCLKEQSTANIKLGRNISLKANTLAYLSAAVAGKKKYLAFRHLGSVL